MHSRVEPHHKYKQSIRRSHPSRTEESIKSHTIHTTKQEISLTITIPTPSDKRTVQTRKHRTSPPIKHSISHLKHHHNLHTSTNQSITTQT